MTTAPAAPAWSVDRWFNVDAPLTLDALRGRVVVLHAFQMLCPGCVSHGIPQAQRVARAFADAPLTVVGLHTVFEHHDVMGPRALEAFLHEYRVTFPVAVDRPAPAGDGIPYTMRAYGMRGTPTVILIDTVGRVRQHVFGSYDDLELGRDLGSLITEATLDGLRPVSTRSAAATPGCDDEACPADLRSG